MQKWAVFVLISKHSFKTLISLVFSLWIINELEKSTLIFAGLQQTKLRKVKSEFTIILFHCLLKHEKRLLVLVPPNNFHYELDKRSCVHNHYRRQNYDFAFTLIGFWLCLYLMKPNNRLWSTLSTKIKLMWYLKHFFFVFSLPSNKLGLRSGDNGR